MAVGRLTTKSKFYIDLADWEQRGRNFRQELYDALCETCKQMYSLEQVQLVDHVHPETGQVLKMDALLDCASAECGSAPEFLNPKMPLTRAIFRAFLASGNEPLSAEEIYARIKKGSPNVILKELLSQQMEDDGIAPV